MTNEIKRIFTSGNKKVTLETLDRGCIGPAYSLKIFKNNNLYFKTDTIVCKEMALRYFDICKKYNF